MIEIRAIKSKLNGTRVNILRKTKKQHPVTNKVTYQFKQLGSFFIEKELIPNEILNTLDNEELFFLQNWLDSAAFCFQFHTLPESMEKVTLSLPERFNESLQHVFIEAKKKGIKFSPHRIMLESLAEESKKMLTALNDNEEGKCFFKAYNGNDNKILFRHLMSLDQPIGKTCFELEEAARTLLNKEKKIPPPQLEDWAGVKSSRNPDKPIKKWAYGIAIDVLLIHNINPTKLIPYEKVAEYWCLPRHENFTLKKAIKEFLTLFHIKEEESARASSAITQIYLHYQIKNLLKF